MILEKGGGPYNAVKTKRPEIKKEILPQYLSVKTNLHGLVNILQEA